MNENTLYSERHRKIIIAATSAADGGAERVAVILANFFYDKGFDVTFVAVLNDKITYPLNNDIKYVFCGERTGNKYTYAYQRSKALQKVVKDAGPCVLISFVILENIFIPKLRNVYKVYTVRNDPSREFSGGIWFHVRNYMYKHADRIVFQTEEEREFFCKKIQEKGEIIGNPISGDLPYWNIDDHDKVVLAAGRLSAQKNFRMLIDAFSIFARNHPDYRLIIYGEGDLRDELAEQIEALGLKDSVLLPGYANDIHKRMANSAIYVSSSDYEGISNSMLEALAIGLPSVCTDCPAGGARQSIQDGVNGLLTEVGNTQMLAEKLSQIADDIRLQAQFSKNAQKLRDELSVNNICAKWYNILNL